MVPLAVQDATGSVSCSLELDSWDKLKLSFPFPLSPTWEG